MGVLRISFYFISVVLISLTTLGQSGEMVITGIVLDHDKLEGVIGTTILNESRGGGAVTDSLGLFTLEAMPGDTILFSDIRFVNTSLIVPDVLTGSSYGIIQVLIPNTTVLKEVKIYSLPSEARFKEIFMSVELKAGMEQKATAAQKSLQTTLREAYEDEKYYYDTWANRSIYELSNEIPPNYLLDPIRWSQFISDFKAEEKKKKNKK